MELDLIENQDDRFGQNVTIFKVDIDFKKHKCVELYFNKQSRM